MWLLSMQGMRPVLIGGAIGAAVSAVAARVLATLLIGIETFEPVALIGAPVVLGLIAWLAAYWPARRASGEDPLTALHTD